MPTYREQEGSAPKEQGIEVTPRSRTFLSTSHAGVVRRKEGSTETELTLSQHAREDLAMVPEADQQIERSPTSLTRPPEDLLRIPYGDFQNPSEEFSLNDQIDALSRPDGIQRSNPNPSSRSVSSDVSFGDKAYRSMPQISLAQDSGSILPHLNTSQKSACSMTVGSKRMAERRAYLVKNGSIKDSTHSKASEEFTRWGGRRDYKNKDNDKKRKKPKRLRGRAKAKAKAKLNADVMAKIESRASMQSQTGRASVWGFAFQKDNHLQYDELIKEDRYREKVASYCEEPFWKIIFHFKGTVLRVLIKDLLFYFTTAIYLAIRILAYKRSGLQGDIEEDIGNLSDTLLKAGTYFFFFLVFYVNQNHARYFGLHQDTMTLMGIVCDVATLVKAILPMERARRINRHMNAAHVAMYTALSSTYEKENFFDPFVARFALLTEQEEYRMVEEIDVDNSGPKAAHEIITWIMCDIRDAQINSCIDTNEAKQLRQKLLQFRSTIAKIFVTSTLPIPFFYVHFLSILTAVYLPLFATIVAYEVAYRSWRAEILSAFLVFLQCLMVIGLRVLGQEMSDPYGGDLIDLQISRYVDMILTNSNQIMAAKRVYAPSIETELRLQLMMSPLGQAFEYDTDDEAVVQH